MWENQTFDIKKMWNKSKQFANVTATKMHIWKADVGQKINEGFHEIPNYSWFGNQLLVKAFGYKL